MVAGHSLEKGFTKFSYSSVGETGELPRRRLLLFSTVVSFLVIIVISVFLICILVRPSLLKQDPVQLVSQPAPRQQVSFVSLSLRTQAENKKVTGLAGSIGPWEIQAPPATGGEVFYEVMAANTLYGLRVLQNATYRVDVQITFFDVAPQNIAGLRVWRLGKLLEIPDSRCINEVTRKYSPCVFSRVLSLQVGDIIDLYSYYEDQKLAASMFNSLIVHKL